VVGPPGGGVRDGAASTAGRDDHGATCIGPSTPHGQDARQLPGGVRRVP
jgi:hypothetical protein